MIYNVFRIEMIKIRKLLFGVICITFVASGQVSKSSATLRLEQYDQSGNCNVTIPSNPAWDITFDRFNLEGDLAPNVTYTRRDPSSVLKVDGKYYVWYSYSLTDAPGKNAPWDLNDLYYASSSDGNYWEEHGSAVERGPVGSYDHRSVFTTEVFYHDGIFYLVYQAAADLRGIYSKNTIGMAHATSPHGPWTKLENPILEPTVSNTTVFDENAVHDPCLIYFKDKFYLYYKGESSETPICGVGVWGLNKQVKWGVAISDNPTGPFVKSEYNPITNTGHEVCVWKSGEGIAIMLHQDGPEFGTLQYAEDGVNFEIKGKVNEFVLMDSSSDYPEAAGLYRPVSEEVSPVSGVSWGLCHILTREQGKFWMYLKRFENTNKELIVNDSDNEGIVTGSLSVTDLNDDSQLYLYPNPVKDVMNIKFNKPATYLLEVISLTGAIVQKEVYDTTVVNTMNLSQVKDGFYILRLTNKNNNNQSYYESFVKKSSE
ncbi:family 43 glycosylhydrolase [Aquimarina sp. RZ0]|uniref:family 43 glycosylhydrolase n=1 Tax=Aquimarina sp. RZ0 TaxID=2607730 RepID=UPI0011F1B7FF|nr:family 43 glycosylhydrolase [Aquimarina sp. RZ0]KAA1246325.1 family 43 glycosylhydrolase [Aquimarina sp. RZ0]